MTAVYPINGGSTVMNKPPTKLLKDGDVEAKWDKKPGYMSDLRSRGMGPAFLRLGPRTVRYRMEDVEAYEAQQRFHNIAESLESDFKAPAAASGEENSARKSRF